MDNNTRVVHIIDNFDPGGAQNILMNIIKHTSRSFNHVLIILNKKNISYLHVLPEATPVHTFNLKSIIFPLEILRIPLKLTQLKPQIINLNLELTYFVFWFIKNWKKRAAINLSIHAIPSQLPRYVFPYITFLNKYIHSYTVEDSIGKSALIEKKVPEEKIFYIPIGTDFFDELNERELTKKQFTGKILTNKNPRFLNIGRMVSGKGQHYLLTAFKKFKDLGNRGVLEIVGYGPLENSLKKSIHQYNLENDVIFTGKSTNLGALYNKSDFFVSSAIDEGMGVVIYDAMASGLPIIAFRAGSIEEVVSQNENGLLVENKNPERMADAMAELSRNPDKYQNISQSNRKKIFHNYRNSQIADQYQKLYTDLVADQI